MEHLIYIIKIFIIIVFSLSLLATEIKLDNISKKIYQNECSSKPTNLIHWNYGEEFVSLGIGHFIWYPKGVNKKFDESFPKFIQFMKNNNYPIPKWLKKLKYSPFKNKNDIKYSPFTNKMKYFLLNSIDQQILFMKERMKNSLNKLLENAPLNLHSHIKKNFYSLLNEKNGDYILIDYINFKGEGIKKSERYNNQGWGLLQVLSDMKITKNPKAEFRKTAKKLLYQRVANSPTSRGEKRWLKGWLNRIDTYK